MIKEIILIIGFITVTEAVLCQPETCLSFQCAETTCPPGFRVKLLGGFCGCCNNCVKALNEGDACSPEIELGNYPKKQGVTESSPMCDYGLICDKETSKCVKRPNYQEFKPDSGHDNKTG